MFDWFDELKASVETGIASGIEAGFKSLGESLNGIGEWFQVPEPAEPYRLIRSFDPAVDRTINQDGITVEQNSWKIESYGEKKILLFELTEPSMSECLLMCEAEVRTADLCKPAKLTLSAKNTAGWIWHRYEAVQGTTTWHTCKVPFHYKKERALDTINISIEFESGGVFWLRNLNILQAAVKPASA